MQPARVCVCVCNCFRIDYEYASMEFDLSPLAAALWMGELEWPLPEGLAPRCRSREARVPWPRAQASDRGVTPSTVEPLT